MSDKNKFLLLNILESIEKIDQYIIDIKDASQFINNKIVFDAVLMNFVIIGELTNKFDQKFKNKYTQIEYTKIKQFRNIVAHDYFGINAEEVW